MHPISPPYGGILDLCYQGLAVDDYSFTLERLESGAFSTFAQSGQDVLNEYGKNGL